MSEDPILKTTFFDKFVTEKKIGEGSFGKIYRGKNKLTNELVALKFEDRSLGHDLLETEAYRLITLKGHCIPKVFSYGNTKEYNIMVMELLGRSLEDCFNRCGKKMSLKSVCMLGIEMIKNIEHVHSKFHIHRDIKPDNFIMGVKENETKLYIIDFGLSKKYRSTTTKEHIPIKTGKKLVGTARYASINTHRGVEQSRRDDLESIGYVLLYFLRGGLPWQGLKINKGEDHYTKIFHKKRDTKTVELCNGYAKEFELYLDYCKALKFEEDPNYDYLIGLFMTILSKELKIQSIQHDYDWIIEKREEKTNSSEVSKSEHHRNILSLLMNKTSQQNKSRTSSSQIKITNEEKRHEINEYQLEEKSLE